MILLCDEDYLIFGYGVGPWSDDLATGAWSDVLCLVSDVFITSLELSTRRDIVCLISSSFETA